MLKFGAVFLLMFAGLTAGFEALRGTAFERVLIEDGLIRPTAAAINRVLPGSPAGVEQRTLSWDGARLRVTRGCEGVELCLLLWSAVIAFPAAPGQRLRALLLGTALAYGLSVLRLVALAATLRYRPDLFGSLHGFALPLLPVVLLGLYFLHWTANAAATPARVDPQAR